MDSQMYKEDLFKKVREEDVIPWVGAGFSKYAGYKLGGELKLSLYQDLNEGEKSKIDYEQPLPEFIDDFIQVKGNRHEIIKKLKTEYHDKHPIDTSVHETLAKIPHIKDIITTNYDYLFEIAIPQTNVVSKKEQIPFIKSEGINLFKLHGRLDDPDSIIISANDLGKSKANIPRDFIWRLIEERVLTKTILFVGYNLEDPNVSWLFENIHYYLEPFQKEIFLVGPNFSKKKKQELKEKGIKYIDDTGENLINELYVNIKNNIIKDFETGLCSPGTFFNFCKIHDLSTQITERQIKAMSGLSKDLEGKIRYTLNDFNVKKQIDKFVAGESFEGIEITKDRVENFDMLVNDLRLHDESDIYSLQIIPQPNKEVSVDIEFEDGGYFEGIQVKIYGSSKLIEIHPELSSSKLTLSIDHENMTSPPVKFNINFELGEVFSEPKKEFHDFSLVKNLFEGKRFNIIFPDNTKISQVFPAQDEMVETINTYRIYFYKLREIEKYFQVSFDSIEYISKEDEINVDNVFNIVKHGFYYAYGVNYVDFKITSLNFDIEALEKENPKATENIPTIITIHGKEIKLGKKIHEVVSPKVLNKKTVEKDGVIKLEPTNGKIKILYE